MLKECICWLHAIWDFICMSSVELRGMQSKQELRNEKSLPELVWNKRPLYLKAGLIRLTTGSDAYHRLKVNVMYYVIYYITRDISNTVCVLCIVNK